MRHYGGRKQRYRAGPAGSKPLLPLTGPPVNDNLLKNRKGFTTMLGSKKITGLIRGKEILSILVRYGFRDLLDKLAIDTG